MAKKDLPLKHATLFSLAGSFNHAEFRFHQAHSTLVDAMFADKATLEAFRQLPPVVVLTHQGFRGTNSTYRNEADFEAALADNEKSPVGPNLGARDVATLGPDKNTLVVLGHTAYVSSYAKPCNSDNPRYAAYVAQFTRDYTASGRMLGLMRAYLANFINGRVLWRNQYGFARRAALAFRSDQGTETFHLHEPAGPDFERLVALATEVAVRPNGLFHLDTAMCVELGYEAAVFPSQPFFDADAKKQHRNVSRDNNYGRVLLTKPDSRGRQQVIFATQKVGNAFRCVDTWYAADVEPIPVELYGANTHLREIHRGNKNSFFDIINEEPRYEDLTDEERDYLMAVFIKGGLLAACVPVPGEEKKGKKAKKTSADEA